MAALLHAEDASRFRTVPTSPTESPSAASPERRALEPLALDQAPEKQRSGQPRLNTGFERSPERGARRY